LGGNREPTFRSFLLKKVFGKRDVQLRSSKKLTAESVRKKK